MKTLTTIEEIKAEAAHDNDAAFFVELNKPIVDWLCECYGINRKLDIRNAESFIRRLKDGDWEDRASDMKINASCTWLIEGHHRLFAIVKSGCYGVKTFMRIIPDALAEKVYANQDCVGKRRGADVNAQTTGEKYAKLKQSLDAARRFCLFADDTQPTESEIKAFGAEHEWFFCDEYVKMRDLDDGKRPCAKATFAFIYAVEKRPDKADVIKAFWNRVVKGVGLTERHPDMQLRKRFKMKTTAQRMRADSKDIFITTLYAISLELRGETRTSLDLTDYVRKSTAQEWDYATHDAPKKAFSVTNRDLRDFEAKHRTVIETK